MLTDSDREAIKGFIARRLAGAFPDCRVGAVFKAPLPGRAGSPLMTVECRAAIRLPCGCVMGVAQRRLGSERCLSPDLIRAEIFAARAIDKLKAWRRGHDIDKEKGVWPHRWRPTKVQGLAPRGRAPGNDMEMRTK